MDELRFETIIAAKPNAVYACWTTDALLMTWLCGRAAAEAGDGGVFTLSGGKFKWAAGTYSAVEENRRLAFTWQDADAPGPTRIELTFSEDGDGTRQTLVQRGFGSGEAWEAYRTALNAMWADAVDNLKVTAETGADARFLRRPLIGLSLYPISEEFATSNNLPFTKGFQITVVFPDTPAYEAGIRPGDFMLELDGVVTATFGDYLGTLNKHKAGESVVLKYYRNGVTDSVTMTLGERKPEVYPDTREGLYEKVNARVTGIEADLEALIADVPEAALAAKPSPGEWSANETLAHMVWAERWYQQVLWLLMTQGQLTYWGGNNEFQLRGILATHRTGAELMAELRRTLREQVEMILAIPDETLAVKPLYTQIAGILSYTGEHCRRHYTQISAAIVRAKQAAVQ